MLTDDGLKKKKKNSLLEDRKKREKEKFQFCFSTSHWKLIQQMSSFPNDQLIKCADL